MGLVIDSYRFAAAGGAFSPPDIAGLVGWWDASDAATITASGGVVSAWADKSPAGHDLTTATGSPTTGVVTIGGLNAIRFTSATIKGASSNVLDWYNADAKSVTMFIVWYSGTSPTYNIGIAPSGNRISMDQRSSAYFLDLPFSVRLTASLTPSTAMNYYDTVRRDGSVKVDFRRDGSTVGIRTTDLTGVATSQTGQFEIGGPAGGGMGVGTAVGELIVYAAGLSDSDVTDVESYIATKWGI